MSVINIGGRLVGPGPRMIVKTCEYCGKTYEVAGKTRLQRKKAKRRQYCTTDCANKAAAADPATMAMATGVLMNNPFAMQAQNVTVFGVELRKAGDA